MCEMMSQEEVVRVAKHWWPMYEIDNMEHEHIKAHSNSGSRTRDQDLKLAIWASQMGTFQEEGAVFCLLAVDGLVVGKLESQCGQARNAGMVEDS